MAFDLEHGKEVGVAGQTIHSVWKQALQSHGSRRCANILQIFCGYVYQYLFASISRLPLTTGLTFVSRQDTFAIIVGLSNTSLKRNIVPCRYVGDGNQLALLASSGAMRKALTYYCLAAATLVASCRGDSKAVDAKSCVGCTIELTHVGTFSDSVEPGVLPDFMVYAMRDRSNRIYTTTRRKDQLLVFDSVGTLVGRLGKSGEGPGEYRNIQRVLVGDADSIYVLDNGLGRVTVYNPSLVLARTQVVPYAPSLVLPGGSFVVASQLPTPDNIGYPVHLLSAAGRLERSFGTDTPQYRADMKLVTNRLVAKADAGNIWTIAPGRYVIEKWSAESGKRLEQIAIKSEWFREIAVWPSDERIRPPAIAENLWQDSAGFVWVVFRVADENWSAPTKANVERAVSAEEYAGMFDWVIEVVDTKSKHVVATKRFPQLLWARPPYDVVVSPRDFNSATLTYDVWHPVLSNHGGVQ